MSHQADPYLSLAQTQDSPQDAHLALPVSRQTQLDPERQTQGSMPKGNEPW